MRFFSQISRLSYCVSVPWGRWRCVPFSSLYLSTKYSVQPAPKAEERQRCFIRLCGQVCSYARSEWIRGILVCVCVCVLWNVCVPVCWICLSFIFCLSVFLNYAWGLHYFKTLEWAPVTHQHRDGGCVHVCVCLGKYKYNLASGIWSGKQPGQIWRHSGAAVSNNKLSEMVLDTTCTASVAMNFCLCQESAV